MRKTESTDPTVCWSYEPAYPVLCKGKKKDGVSVILYALLYSDCLPPQMPTSPRRHFLFYHKWSQVAIAKYTFFWTNLTPLSYF